MKQYPVYFQHIVNVVDQFEALANKVYAPYGLDETQNEIMVQLYQLDNHATYNDLAVTTMLSKGTISRQLSELENKGMVRTYTNPEKQNQKCVDVLPGNPYSDIALANVEIGNQMCINHLQPEEAEVFLGNLKSILEHIKPKKMMVKEPSEKTQYLHYLSCIAKQIRGLNLVQVGERGFDYSQNLILHHLYQFGDCSYKVIEGFVDPMQSGVSKQMKKLLEKDYITSYTDKSDMRVRYAKLTKKGMQQARLYNKAMLLQEKKAFADMSEEDISRFDSFLSKIEENFK